MGLRDLFNKKINRKELKVWNSPNCNIQAVIQEENNCVYFYLYKQTFNQENSIEACWVRNYVVAANELDVQSMKKGYQPMLPSKYCKHPEGAEKLQQSLLDIVWFEEGDGAALFYDNEILCVIPGWSTPECPGFSKDCKEVSKYSWPLGNPSENDLYEKVNKAKSFWESWNENSWFKIQTEYLNAIERSFGNHYKYYAIDEGKWPPKAIVTIEMKNLIYVLTIGVSVIPQPKVELYYEEPHLYRRIELGFVTETEIFNRNKDNILSYISGITNLPWSQITMLGHGHTISSDQVFTKENEFPYTLLLNCHIDESLPKIDFPLFNDDPINLLWIVPITNTVKQYVEVNGVNSIIENTNDLNDLVIFKGKNKFNCNFK